MPIEHVNRRGDRYYLLSGKTKTGKPKYYFSKKLQGTPVDVIPEGFEIYESPEGAQVFLRKEKPCHISAFERELVAEGIRRHAGFEHFIVDAQDREIVIYVADMPPNRAVDILGEFLGPFGTQHFSIRQWAVNHARYSKMLRFILEDEKERLYHAQRWCFRGSIDDWISLIGPPAPLDTLVATYAPHLEKESFFELF
jgi:hypothetical protein